MATTTDTPVTDNSPAQEVGPAQKQYPSDLKYTVTFSLSETEGVIRVLDTAARASFLDAGPAAAVIRERINVAQAAAVAAYDAARDARTDAQRDAAKYLKKT